MDKPNTGNPNSGMPNSGNDGGSKYIPESEFRKVIEQRDRLKKERKELQEKLKELSSKVDSLNELQEQLERYKELEEQLEQYKQKEEEEKKKRMDEVEKLKYEKEKLIGELDKLKKQLEASIPKDEYEKLRQQLQEKETKLNEYMEYRLKADIVNYAMQMNAVNPEQIFWLTKHRFKVNEDGEFVVEEKTENGGIVELSPKEYLEKFLSAPENSNLIKQDVQKKTPREDTGDNDSGGTSSSSGQKVSLSDADKRKAASMGLTEEEYYEIVILPMERKLKKMKGELPSEDNANKQF